MAKKKLAGLSFEPAKKPKLINDLNQQSYTEKEKIKASLKLHPELRKYMPPHSGDQFETLEQAILDDKRVREKILAWEFEGAFYILDGYTRYSIVQKHAQKDIPWDIELVSGVDSLEEAKRLMRKIQLGRRNLFKNQISYLRGTTYLEEKQGKGGDRKSNPQNGELKGSTVERLAEEFKVGKNTIERDAHFALGADRFLDENLPEELQQERDSILLGESELLKKDIEFLGKNPAIDLVLYVEFRKAGGQLETLLALKGIDEQNELLKLPRKPAKTAEPKKTTEVNAESNSKPDRFHRWWESEHKAVEKLVKKGDQQTKAQKKSELQQRMESLQKLIEILG